MKEVSTPLSPATPQINNLEVNYQEALRFLKTLTKHSGGLDAGVGFRHLPQAGIGHAGNIYCRNEAEIKLALPKLKIKNTKEGQGIFVVTNKLKDGKDFSRNNFASARSFYVDFDTVCPETPPGEISPIRKAFFGAISEFFTKPDMIIETSPDKFQVYWLINELDSLKMQEKNACQGQDVWKWYEATQLMLAELFCGDPLCKGIERITRMPGFFHTKKKLNMPPGASGESFNTKTLINEENSEGGAFSNLDPVDAYDKLNDFFEKNTCNSLN